MPLCTWLQCVAGIIIALLACVSLGQPLNYTAGAGKVPKQLTPQEANAHCSKYDALFTNIDNDLRRWKEDGIPLSLMNKTILMHTTRRGGQKGFAGTFWNGKAYLLDEPVLKTMGHHSQLFFIYMRYMLYLQQKFVMPDVDFVISTIDRPLGLQINASSSDEPVFRFCKSSSHADVLIPIFHFNMKNFDRDLLDKVQEINQLFPWTSKKEELFGRFSLYSRHYHALDPAMPPRLGAGGQDICQHSTPLTRSCEVRKHFVQWSRNFSNMDVSNAGRIPMAHHAKYKYLVHLDGQGLSSRFDQLLPLGSLVVKEQSGYRAFYHHLLKPYEHYVPFWKQGPEDVLQVLDWAKANDAEAQRIAVKGQQLAAKYLNHDARACYWYRLLTEFSKLLKYKAGKQAGRTFMEYYRPVEEYLDTVAKAHENGKWLKVLHNFAP